MCREDIEPMSDIPAVTVQPQQRDLAAAWDVPAVEPHPVDGRETNVFEVHSSVGGGLDQLPLRQENQTAVQQLSPPAS